MVRARCCFDIRRVMRAMVRTYQITMGRAYYKCTLRFSSTSNVTDTNVSASVINHICISKTLLDHGIYTRSPPSSYTNTYTA